MNTYCTIITKNYLPFAKVLFASIQSFTPQAQIQVLVVDSDERQNFGNFYTHLLADLENEFLFKSIQRKYGHSNPDYFRWSLKPVFIASLLQKDFSKVIYVDPDIFFIGDPGFLFEKLDHAGILLTPHWTSISPERLESKLVYLMRNGLFNAGFIGANRSGIEAITWWAEACHYKIEKQPELGIYVDQKYLDVFPIEFPYTEILQHRGCNIASWNMDSNARQIINGRLMINKKYEGIFIHFTFETIHHILNGNDIDLMPSLQQYRAAFNAQGFELQEYISSMPENVHITGLRKIKRRLLIRTRFKRWLLRISQKI